MLLDATAWRRCAAAFCAWLALWSGGAAHGAVSTVTVFSSSNQRNLSFQVYTPPQYAAEASRRFPVVFSLHGIGGTSLQRANLYATDARCTNQFRRAVAHDLGLSRRPDQLVLRRRVRRAQAGLLAHHRRGAAVRRRHYRTIADRDHRAMEGFSMGGFGAAMYHGQAPRAVLGGRRVRRGAGDVAESRAVQRRRRRGDVQHGRSELSAVLAVGPDGGQRRRACERP